MGRLGEFEQAILFSVLRLGDEAFGLAIRDAIEEHTGRAASPGSIYTTLGRLEERGLVDARTESGTRGRLGRPRKYYALTTAGADALLKAYTDTQRLAEGLLPKRADIAGR